MKTKCVEKAKAAKKLCKHVFDEKEKYGAIENGLGYYETDHFEYGGELVNGEVTGLGIRKGPVDGTYFGQMEESCT